jgi:hypothetical protein
MQFAMNLGRIGSSQFGAVATLAVMATQVITFYRITQLFRVLRGHKAGVAQPIHGLPVNSNA